MGTTEEEEANQNSWLVPVPEEITGTSLALQQLTKDNLLHLQSRSTDRTTYSSLLWQTLCTIPRLVQSQCESVIALCLQFLALHYPSLYRDEWKSVIGEQYAHRATQHNNNRKLANNRLMDYLKLFALFHNPASLPSASLLKEVYIRYLAALHSSCLLLEVRQVTRKGRQ